MIVKNTKTRFYLLLLVLAAFAWRVQGLTNQSLWRDEVDAVYFALRNVLETLAMFKRGADNGVLYFLTLRPWFYLVGASEFALRYPSALAGTLSVPLLWQVARQLVRSGECGMRNSPEAIRAVEDFAVGAVPEVSSQFRTPHSAFRIPFLAALFLAFNPYQLWYGQEGKMYAVIMVLTLLATWFWLKGIERGGWRPWLAYLVTVSLAIYTHLLMVLLIPLHLIWFLLAWPQSRQHWRGYGLALAGLTLPYLPMVWWQWDMLTTSEHKTGFSFTPLTEMLHLLLLSHSRGFLPSNDLLRLAPLFFLGLAGLVLGMSEMGETKNEEYTTLAAWRRFSLVLTWLIAPILSIYLVSLRQPIFTERYIIWLAPALMLLLALGVQAVMSNAGSLGRLLAGVFIVYVLGFWLYAGWQQKTMPMKYDLRDAVTYIAERRSPDTLLILQIPYMEFSYRYYSSNFTPHLFAKSDAKLGKWVGGLWTNDGSADDQARSQVDQQMQQMTAGAKELWVMRSEVEMWDARHLMDEWLDQHGEVVDQAEFLGTQVKHYQMQK
ncbi:MAG: glycosyltransferase family 39 protein [Caldilineaceae bacterium]